MKSYPQDTLDLSQIVNDLILLNILTNLYCDLNGN